MNLALTLAIGNKCVLFIDADLRDASASRNWQAPKRGVTDYLAGHETDYSQLLFHLDDYPTLDILPSGMVPSNPTELLRSPLLGQLLSAVRPLYDCIIIDSPSAGMLADAEILGKHADCTLFVIRAGRFNRRNLDELKPIQTEESHRLQYVILNGVSIDSRYGYAYVHKYDRSGMSERSIRSKTKQYIKKCIQFIHPATSTKA
jgi:capsular exopolysaccharide synthesis family protein